MLNNNLNDGNTCLSLLIGITKKKYLALKFIIFNFKINLIIIIIFKIKIIFYFYFFNIIFFYLKPTSNFFLKITNLSFIFFFYFYVNLVTF